ncbi:MAG: DNA topoisomerase I [Verrucomicrobiota bacterium]
MIPQLLNNAVIRPVLRPLTRFFVGVIAIPLFRIFLTKVARLDRLDAELEKDLEQWFRTSLMLLVATANMEQVLFGWVPLDLQGDQAWIAVLFRLLLAVGVIEAMPDQELFAIIHPGPPKIKPGKKMFGELWRRKWEFLKGLFCQHINRSSPVFAIMAAIFGGEYGETSWTVGWVCYGLAIGQYLAIGLVTSRDKAMDVIGEFDRKVADYRAALVEEFGEEAEEELGVADEEKPPEK